MARFMIVDDSLFQRKNIEKMITKIGGEVVAQASDGKEAIELYSIIRPDIVLMDLLMPGMEGIEAVKRIIEVDKKAKIIVISSIGYKEIVDRALFLGAKKFIMKPFDINHITTIIRSVLEM
jgi:two-component system chemotaxis response regulator CheY